MDNEEYLKDLTQKLRWRHLGDAAVRQALREVVSEVRDAQVDPEKAFGPVDAYATSFPRGRQPAPGFLLATIGAIVAALVAAGYVLSTIVGVSSHDLGRSLLVYGLALVFMVVAVVTGAMIDRRLPAGVRT